MPIDEYTPTKLPYELSRAADDGGKSYSAGMPHEPTAAHLLQPAAEVGWFLSQRCEAAWERRRNGQLLLLLLPIIIVILIIVIVIRIRVRIIITWVYN